METTDSTLLHAIMACLFAALISVGAYIAIPLPATPVPVVLQNMFILLAGFILGPWWGLASVVFYLLLGSMGLPVFSGGTGGLVKFAGPTGGYLFGFIPGVVIFGLVSRLGKHAWYFNLMAGAVGMVHRLCIRRCEAEGSPRCRLDKGPHHGTCSHLFPAISQKSSLLLYSRLQF